jgi:RND family efflux transporter MFP subunit
MLNPIHQYIYQVIRNYPERHQDHTLGRIDHLRSTPNVSGKEIAKFCTIPLIALMLSACGKEESRPSEPAIRPVKIMTITSADKLQTARYPAVIQAGRTTELAFQVSGLLAELPVNESQKVQQGQLIAKLDPRDFVSNVKSAKSQYDLANNEYQRAVRLSKSHAIAQKELEQRKSELDSSQAQLDTTQKALSDSELKAPYAGVIAKVPVKQFQNVQPGTVIVTLIDTQEWEATVNMPASLIASTPTRQSEGAFVVLGAAPNALIPATFKTAVLEADAVSQTYAVTFAFEAPEHLLILPGMNATIILKSSDKQAIARGNNVAVPLAAVMSDGRQQFVWVVDNESMSVSKRPVSVQQGIGETLVITEGLTAGESIVAAGAAYLSEGLKVRPWTD